MYGIIFKLDHDFLDKMVITDDKKYHMTPAVYYGDIEKVLGRAKFNKINVDFYISDESINEVDCILASQELCHQLDWFKSSCIYFKYFRITEMSDLTRAITNTAKSISN